MYLLDMAGGAILVIAPILFFVLLLVWGLVEGAVLTAFRIFRFKKAVWRSVVINLITLVLGFVIITIAQQSQWKAWAEMNAKPKALPMWGMLLLLTILTEAVLVKWMNRSATWKAVFLASIIMNVLSYAVMYAMVYFN